MDSNKDASHVMSPWVGAECNKGPAGAIWKTDDVAAELIAIALETHVKYAHQKVAAAPTPAPPSSVTLPPTRFKMSFSHILDEFSQIYFPKAFFLRWEKYLKYIFAWAKCQIRQGQCL